MRKFLDWLTSTDLVTLAFEIGLAFFILVTFVRCTFQ